MKYSCFRIIISFFLVLVLIVNISPIKAHASLAAGLISSPYLVPVATVVAAALIAVGIMAGSDHTSFSEVVNNGVTWLTESTSYVVNGMVNVLGIVGADGVVRSYIAKDLIQGLWNWSFDSEVVVDSSPSLFSEFCNPASSSTYLFDAPVYIVCHHIHSMTLNGNVSYNYKYWAVSNTSFSFTISGYSQSYSSVQSGSVFWAQVGSGSTGSMSFISGVHYVDYGLVDDITTSSYMTDEPFSIPSSELTCLDGLVLGQIQAPTETEQLEDAEVYTDYITEITFAPGGVWEPDGEDKKDEDGNVIKVPCLPIGIPSIDYDDSVITQTQNQAQSGETNLDFDFETSGDTTTDTETGTGSGTASGSQDITDYFTPSGSITDYSLDLTALFPFCIPFDIYNFLSVLKADPVAPFFEFDLNLGVASAPICIDLSGWSDLASVVRALEVALFCVGLALKTKELIGT